MLLMHGLSYGPALARNTKERASVYQSYKVGLKPNSSTVHTFMFGNLEGAVRRGRDGKEKEWTDCVQSDIRAFGITEDWKAMALKAEVWVEAVTEGGRRFMASWREEEEDAARHRQEKREATRQGKLLSHTEAA